MESQRETKWGQLAIPQGRRVEFDKLAVNLTFEDVDRELSEVEDAIEGFLSAAFNRGTFNRGTIRGLFEYGINGSLEMFEGFYPGSLGDRFAEAIVGVSDINRFIDIYSDFDVLPSLGIIATINAVTARAQLDRFRLKGCDEFLSIQEVALLARMRELSIRNAASPSSSTPLKTSKSHGLTIIHAEEANRWLPGRRGYKATALPKGEAETRELFNALDSWVFG